MDALNGRRSSGAEIPDAAKLLVGLGPGLTPSGDDLLGGLLVGLRRFHCERVADALAEWVLSHAWERTNIISCAHLENAAKGDCGEVLQETLNAIMNGNKAALSEGIAALDTVGHTSGRDALTGVTLALRAAFETRS